MGVDKGKTKNTKKLLTKRDKIKKRVARVHKAIARKKDIFMTIKYKLN